MGGKVMLHDAKGMAKADPRVSAQGRGPEVKPPIPAFAGTLGGKLAELAHRYLQEAAESMSVWRERRALARELTELDDVALADLGLVRGQIPILVRAHPAAANLLGQMLKRLGLESEERPLEAGMREDLYRVCVQCIERKHCRRWLASPSSSQEGLKAFCPNAWMFDLLRHRIAEVKTNGRIAH